MERLKVWLPPLLTGLLAVLLVLALGRSLFLFLDYMRTLIAFPFSVDYGEGPVLDQVMRLAKFQSIYPTDLSQLPFTIGNYPPFYHLVQLPFAWLFGPAFWFGRLINLFSILLAAVFIGLTVFTLTQDQLAAFIGGLLLPGIPYIVHWSGFVRVDALALGLSWAGLYSVVRWSAGCRGIVAAAACLTAAVFTRQSYGLAAPVAAFGWLLSRKPRFRAFELALWTGGLSLALFLLFNILTGGGFYFNIVTANVNPFFWETVRNYSQAIWEHMPVLVVINGIYVLAAAWSGWRVLRSGDPTSGDREVPSHGKAFWLAAPYLLASTATAITVGKDGSNVNYLYELSAALSFTAALFLSWLGRAWVGSSWRSQRWVGRRWGLVVFGLLLMLFQVDELYRWTREDYYRSSMDRVANEHEPIAEIARLVSQADGPVLADEFMGLIPLSGKPLVFQPFEFKQLAIGGIWDETPFLRAVSDQQFDLILLYDPPNWDSKGARWTPAQLGAIRSSYRLAGRLADTQVYVPIVE